MPPPNTGLTSQGFTQKFSDKYAGATPSYHGAAQWGAGVALMKSIELAGTLETSKVVQQLANLDLQEFYGGSRFAM